MSAPPPSPGTSGSGDPPGGDPRGGKPPAEEPPQAEPPQALPLAAIVVGALILGVMWRIRGDQGYGGFWGMVAVGQVFCLALFATFGTRDKVGPGIYPLSFLLLAATVGGWGTLNTQITGLLGSDRPFPGAGEVATVAVHPLSGVFLMLCLGFGWAGLFAFLMGRLFGRGPLRGPGVGIALLAYAAASLLAKAVLAPWLLAQVSPSAVDLFSQGLVAHGLDDGVRSFHLAHLFGDDAPEKAIPGGRNYFASVDAIASAFAAVVLWAWVRWVRRDRVAARVLFGICASFALAITVADLWLFLSCGGFRRAFAPPTWLKGWEMWEFSTGLLAGLGVMAVLARVGPAAPSARVRKTSRLAAGLIAAVAVFLFHLPLARAIVAREPGLSPLAVSPAVLLLVAAVAIWLGRRFVRLEGEPHDFPRYASLALPPALILHLLVYLFVGPEAAVRQGPDLLALLMVGASVAALILHSRDRRIRREIPTSR